MQGHGKAGYRIAKAKRGSEKRRCGMAVKGLVSRRQSVSLLGSAKQCIAKVKRGKVQFVTRCNGCGKAPLGFAKRSNGKALCRNDALWQSTAKCCKAKAWRGPDAQGDEIAKANKKGGKYDLQ